MNSIFRVLINWLCTMLFNWISPSSFDVLPRITVVEQWWCQRWFWFGDFRIVRIMICGKGLIRIWERSEKRKRRKKRRKRFVNDWEEGGFWSFKFVPLKQYTCASYMLHIFIQNRETNVRVQSVTRIIIYGANCAFE